MKGQNNKNYKKTASAEGLETKERDRTQDGVEEWSHSAPWLLDEFPCAVWRSDKDGKCDYVNRAWLNLRGRTMEQELGDGWTEGVHPDDLDFCLKTYLDALNARQAFEIEYRLRGHDGEYRWMSDCGRPFNDLEGIFAGYVGTCFDTTERKRTEESMKLFRSLLDRSSDAIEVIDPETLRFLDCNQSACQCLGYSREEFLALSVFDIDAKIDESRAGAIAAEMKRSGFAMFESIHRRKDGSTFPVEVNVREIQLERAYRLAIVRDITERQRAEEALREAERKYREIFENAGEGIFQSTPDGRFISANPALARMHGFDSPEDLIRSRDDISRQVYVNSARREEFKRLLEEHGIVRGFEHQVVRKDGSKIWISVNARAVSDKRGGILYYEGTAQDINERKLAEEALRRSEMNLADFFENGAMGLHWVGPDGAVLRINQAELDLLGYTRDECIGHNIAEFHADRTVIDDILERLQTGEVLRDYEARLRCKDGSIKHVQINSSVYWEEGKFVHSRCFILDITERKRAEATSAAFAALARKLSGARTPLDAGRIVAQTAVDLFDWDAFDLILYDADRDLVHPMLNIDTIGGRKTEITPSVSQRKPTAKSRRVIDHGPELRLREQPLQFDPDVLPFGDKTRPSASIMTVPARHADSVVGLLSVHSYTLHKYDVAALADLEALADHCGEALNRIQAEQSLYESEARFRQMADHFEDIVWIADRDITKALYINPAYEKVFGRSCESLYERLESFIDAVHPDDRDAVWRMLERQRAGDGEPFEYRIVRPDGSVRWILRRSFPIRNNDGEIFRMAGIGQDITERKRAEAALKETERVKSHLVEKLNEAQSVAMIGSWEWNLQTDHVWWSDETYQIFGVTPQDHVPSFEANRKFIHPDDFAGYNKSFEHSLQTGEPLDYEFRLVTNAGVLKNCLGLGKIVYDDSNQPIRFIGTVMDITERKRAETKLRESEKQLRDAQRIARIGSWNWDIQNNHATWSEELLNIFGIKSEAFCPTYEGVSKWVHPEDRAVVEKTVQTALTDLKPHHYNYRIVRPDGTVRIIHAEGEVVCDERGRPIALAGTAKDVTERKQAEEALRESVERYRDLVENSREFICTHDLDGLILSANRAAVEVLGYDPKDFCGKKNFRDLLVPEFRDQFDEYLARIRRDGFASGLTVVQTKRGDRRILDYHNTVRTEGVDTPIVRGMARDITEQKHAERALRASEERYRELFENAKDAIYVHDLSGRYTSVNRAAERLSGFTRAEILGKHFSNFVLPRDLKHVRTNLCRKLDEENETVYEVDMVRRDGQRVPVEVSSRLIFESGVAVGVQGVARDVTERKRAQEALRIYSQRLIAAQEVEREKVARELHDEIGQVLTAVRINLQSIQRSYRTHESVSRLDESIGIVDDALGRVRELSIELRPALLDDLGLSVALRWYVDRYAQRTGIIAQVLNGFEDDARLPRELETACFRIAQEALTNVARHAQAVSVSVQLERSRERMLLTIMDDGVGFKIDDLRNSASAASALGLRGMEERALAVGGYIEIDSGPGRGTRIRATFPFKRR